MSKLVKNERGLTLLELLAAATLTALISVFAIGLLIKGINHYNIISTDTAFRDEADLLMVSLVKELYTTRESEIEIYPVDGCSGDCFFLIKKNDGDLLKSGFDGNELVIQGESISTTNPSINISSDSKIKKSGNGVYSIELVLEMPIKSQLVTFENDVRTINDIKTEVD